MSPFLLFCLLTFMSVECRSITSKHGNLRDCEWQRLSQLPKSVSDKDADATATSESLASVVSCRIRTIRGTDTLLSNLTATQMDDISTLRLECSDVLFFESSLGNSDKHYGGGFLGQLRRLHNLSIEYCKIRYVPSAVFASLRELRHLSVRTHNTDWSAMTMELQSDSFHGLNELRSLDLAYNNIRAVPSKLFCVLDSLEVLNLTRNRLQDITELGFSDWVYGPSATGKSCNVRLEALDLSRNQISFLPDNGLSSLRSLRHLDLQYNSIAALADRALVGLPSLLFLDVSSNALISLPPELFHSSPYIKSVVLKNNSISVLPPGVLEGLDNLFSLDFAFNDLSNNCINRNTFSGLSGLTVLHLSYNNITRIDSHVFRDLSELQYLSLRNNSIEVITEGAFSNLGKLRSLILSHNKLRRLESYHFTGLNALIELIMGNNHIETVHPHTFEKCTNLKVVELDGNKLKEVPEMRLLHELKTLDLGDNYVSRLSNTSFEGLVQVFMLRMNNNKVVNISRDVFSAVPSLQVLNLAYNKIQVVDQDAFRKDRALLAIRLDGNLLTNVDGIFTHLAALKWLNLSDNQLTRFDYTSLPNSLEWIELRKNKLSKLGNYFEIRSDLRIKMLDASFNMLTEISDTSIPNSVERVLLSNNMIKKVQPNTFVKKVNLTEAVLFANELENLDFGALRLQPVPEDRDLPRFYIGGNTFNCDCTMEWLHRINQLAYLRQHPRVMDLDSVTCRLSYTRGEVSRQLLDLKPSQFLCPYETHCFALCHCCDFDACDCEMACPENCTCYHDHTWSANVVDCSNGGHKSVPANIPMDATEIYLDGNDLKELDSHVFIGKKKLQVLYLNGSNVAEIHNRTFNGVPSLRVLHLENNRLQELRGFEFDQLENLNELYLDHNSITHVGNKTFSTMPSLEVLRLEENKIVNFSPWQHLAAASGSLAKVSLDGNKWTCDCESVSRLEEWLRENKGTISGSDPSKMLCLNGGNKKQNETVANFIKRCNEDNQNTLDTSSVQKNPLYNNSILGISYVLLLAASLTLITVLLLVTAVIYVFREDVSLWAHSRYGIRLFNDSTNSSDDDCDDTDRPYDAYMVYSFKDDEFITMLLSSKLEQCGYSLCLHYRDIHDTGGTTYLADSVMSAAEASRRIIIYVSLNFLQTEWERPELRASLQASLEQTRVAQRRNKVIFLLTTEPQALNLDPYLQLHMNTSKVLSWEDKRFWMKLRYAMPDVVAVKKNIEMNTKLPSIALNDLRRKVGRDHECVQSTSKVASNRYHATTTSLDSWYKYSAITRPQLQQQAIALVHHVQPTPTATQSSYVSENSSQRTTADHEEEEEESSATTSGSHQYEYPEHHDVRGYTRHHHRHLHLHRHKNNHRNHHYVYNTIPDSIPLTHPHSRLSSSGGEHSDNCPAAVRKLNNANSVVVNGQTYFV